MQFELASTIHHKFLGLDFSPSSKIFLLHTFVKLHHCILLLILGRAKPVPPPRSHSLEQHNYADHKKQPTSSTSASITEGNDIQAAAAPSSAPSPSILSNAVETESQESPGKNENLIMGEQQFLNPTFLD